MACQNKCRLMGQYFLMEHQDQETEVGSRNLTRCNLTFRVKSPNSPRDYDCGSKDLERKRVKFYYILTASFSLLFSEVI
jgi:hypothetical protein